MEPNLENDGKDLIFDPETNPPWHPGMPQPDKPAYHCFWVEREFEYEGFNLGLITVPEISDGEEYGDGFLIAPDDSRCGLIYEVGKNADCKECMGFEPRRWGVWNVTVTSTMTTEEGRRKNLEELVGMLRGKWENWKSLNA